MASNNAHAAQEESPQEIREEIKTTVTDIRRANRVFVIMVFAIAILLAALLYVAMNQETPPQTFDELYQATLDGDFSENNYLYRGFVFVYDSYIWKTIIQDRNGETYRISVNYDPRSVEKIPAQAGMRNTILPRDNIVLTTDANLTSNTVRGIYEVGRVLGNKYGFYGKNVSVALTTPVENYATITCDDATAQQGVIYFHLADKTQVYAEGYCVHVTGTSEDDIVRAADKLLYVLIDIMPEPEPKVDGMRIMGNIADWEGASGSDGVLLTIAPSRDQKPVALEGRFNVSVRQDGNDLYVWQPLLTVTSYDTQGVARIRLSASPEEIYRWSLGDNITLAVDFMSRGGLMTSTVIPLDISLRLSGASESMDENATMSQGAQGVTPDASAS